MLSFTQHAQAKKEEDNDKHRASANIALPPLLLPVLSQLPMPATEQRISNKRNSMDVVPPLCSCCCRWHANKRELLELQRCFSHDICSGWSRRQPSQATGQDAAAVAIVVVALFVVALCLYYTSVRLVYFPYSLCAPTWYRRQWHIYISSLPENERIWRWA